MEEWEEEPDLVKFEHVGLRCVVSRHPAMLHLCGYVELPQGHKDHGTSPFKDMTCYDVHGGITFGPGPLKEDPSRTYIGFDCAHLYDFVPGTARISGFYTQENELCQYRNLYYVIQQTKELAEQVARVGS